MMRLARSVLAILLVALPSLAQDLDPDRTLPVDPAVRIGELDNGLRFYIRENHRPEHRANLRLVVNAGSLLEEDDQQGLAHFLEHMAFNGTTHFAANDLVSYLESIGMRFGPDLNAYTSFDETVYMLEVPVDSTDALENGFLVLRDWATGIENSPEEVEKERGVVLEEWRRGQGAQERIRRKQFPVLFHDSRYAERLPIGKPEIIENAPPERITSFYRKWYRPGLMAVIAVGDFDADRVEGWIRENFASIPAPETPTVRPVYDVPPHRETLAASTTDKEMTQTRVVIFFKHPHLEEGTVGAYRQGLVDRFFSAMLNDRFREISEKPDSPFLFAFAGEGGLARTEDAFTVGAVAREGEAKTALTAVMTEVERIRQHGFTPGELERTKADYRTSIEHAYKERDKTENDSYVGEYTRNFLTGEPIPGIQVERDLGLALADEITLDEVEKDIDRLVHEGNTVILAAGPEKEGAPLPDADTLLAAARTASEASTEPYRDTVGGELLSELPEPGEVASRKVYGDLGVTVLTLGNGVEVWLKPTDFKDDQILFSGESPGGTSLASKEDYPSAAFATAYLGEAGYGGYTPTELEKLLAGKLASASPWIDTFAHGFRGSASPEDLETALQLLYLVWTRPNDRPEAMDVILDRYRSFLANREASPEARYGDRITVINHSDHYMFQPPSVERLDRLDREKALAFYRKITADASDFRFFFVGAFDPESIEPLLARYLGSLPSDPGTPPSFEDPEIRFPRGSLEERVYAGTEPKSTTRITWPAHTGLDEYTMFYLGRADHALEIRLRELLREELGSTYSVGVGHSMMLPYPGYETTTVSYGCSPENAERLKEVVFAEVAKFKAEGPTEEETEKVKEQELKSIEERERQNGYWLGSLSTVARLGWDPESILRRRARAESITREKLHDTVSRFFPDDDHTVIVLLPESWSEGPPRDEGGSQEQER